MNTLRKWASMIAEYNRAEAIQPWLAEREGVQLRVWRELDHPRRDGWMGGWCAALVRPGGVSIASLPHDQISEAIEAACEAFEQTEATK